MSSGTQGVGNLQHSVENGGTTVIKAGRSGQMNNGSMRTRRRNGRKQITTNRKRKRNFRSDVSNGNLNPMQGGSVTKIDFNMLIEHRVGMFNKEFPADTFFSRFDDGQVIEDDGDRMQLNGTRQDSSDKRLDNIRNDGIIDESTIVFEDETDDRDVDT